MNQQKIISTHKRKEPLVTGDNLYLLQDSKERLKQVLDEICR